MNTVDRIKAFLLTEKCDVFIRSEFSTLGSATQVSRALKALLQEEVLVRLGLGVYAKAKPSALTGKPIPSQPLEVLIPDALLKLGVDTKPSRLSEAYNAGQISQVPAGITFRTPHRRTMRKLGFNGQMVNFEPDN